MKKSTDNKLGVDKLKNDPFPHNMEKSIQKPIFSMKASLILVENCTVASQRGGNFFLLWLLVLGDTVGIF